MKRFLLAPLILGLAAPVQARVDPEVHKLCLKASDYKGCVEAQSGAVKSKPIVLTGNKCPKDFAYIGDGLCREVVRKTVLFTKAFMAMPALVVYRNAGNKSIDSIGLWRAGNSLKPTGRHFSILGDAVTKTISDQKCPAKEPAIYTNSTCDQTPTAPSLAEIKYFFTGTNFSSRSMEFWNIELEKLYGVKNLATNAKNYGSSKKKNRLPMACREGIWDKDDPRCQIKVEKIMSPMDMD